MHNIFQNIKNGDIQSAIDQIDDIIKEKVTDIINEARPQVFWRVSSTGGRVKKVLCPKGHKRSGARNCIPVTGSSRVKRLLSARIAGRKRRSNPAKQKQATRKRLKAMRKRKAQGIKTGSRIG